MNRASRDRIFRILDVASRWEIRQRKRVGRVFARVSFWGLWIQAGLFLVALGFGLIRSFGAPDWSSYTSLITLLLYYIAALATPLVAILATILRHRIALKKVIKNPILIPLWNARITASVDARFLPIIMRQPLEDIEFVLLEVKAEREFYERRVSLLVGAIEKIGVIGLVPGFLAAWKAFQTYSDPPFWAISLGFAIGFIYFFGFVAHFQMMRLERMLRLLDLAVIRKKAELTSPGTGAPSAA